MAVRTLRLGVGNDGNFAAASEADQTAASRADGWTVGKLAAANSSEFDAGLKQATGTFSLQSTTAKPNLFVAGPAATNANAIKTAVPYSGVFAATAWTLTFAMRATVASAQAGRVRLRVFKSVNADGSAATELTGATQVGTTSAALSTTADGTSVVTWSPGALTLNNEYLFFVVAWEITTASGSNTGDVVFRTGQAAAGSRIVTPNFNALVPLTPGQIGATSTVSGVTRVRRAITPAQVAAVSSVSGAVEKVVGGMPVVPALIAASSTVVAVDRSGIVLPVADDVVESGWWPEPLWTYLTIPGDAVTYTL